VGRRWLVGPPLRPPWIAALLASTQTALIFLPGLSNLPALFRGAEASKSDAFAIACLPASRVREEFNRRNAGSVLRRFERGTPFGQP